MAVCGRVDASLDTTFNKSINLDISSRSRRMNRMNILQILKNQNRFLSRFRRRIRSAFRSWEIPKSYLHQVMSPAVNLLHQRIVSFFIPVCSL